MKGFSPALRCALADGVPRRSFIVALLVGTVLNLIGQGDAIVGTTPLNWFTISLTDVVPYRVSTYGAVSFRMQQLRRA